MTTLIGRTFEGTVENGLVRLSAGVVLPERSKVYVVLPDEAERPVASVRSPHLAHSEQAASFVKQVLEPDDARV